LLGFPSDFSPFHCSIEQTPTSPTVVVLKHKKTETSLILGKCNKGNLDLQDESLQGVTYVIDPSASLSPPPERKKEKKKGLTKRWNSGKKLELSTPHSVNP
jgi:hypothetical protein